MGIGTLGGSKRNWKGCFNLKSKKICAAVLCCLAVAVWTSRVTAGETPAQASASELPPGVAEAPGRSPNQFQTPEPEPTFEINEFRIQGNTIFATGKLVELLDQLAGSDRTAADVEKGRDILEQFYHEQGYPTVLVNIPEQSAAAGSILLQVIETPVGAVRVLGNRHFSSQQILSMIPSVAPGSILYLPALQEEVGRVNRNPDLKVVPSMSAGKEAGTVEVEFKAEDHSSFHGSLELSNRYSANTTPLRLNAGLHYDNLWNRLHSLSLQYQISPENPNQVEVFSGSYTLPAPWNSDLSLVLYGVSSDSNSAFGEGFHTVGKGSIIGARCILPLPSLGAYNQSSVLGLDYKKFNEVTGTVGSGSADVATPIEYLPFTFAYSGSLPDSGGLTLFNAGLNLSFRGAVAQEGTFQNKRFLARGNYAAATMGLERRQQLPGGAGFLLKMDGQLADQPLVSNEQFSAGGMESVRGYLESSQLGDNAFHAVTELSSPDLAPRLGLGERFQVVPYLFYDCAALWIRDPLPGQESSFDLQGTGVGVRGFLFRSLEYQVDWAFALSDTGTTKTGDNMVHFKLKYQF